MLAHFIPNASMKKNTVSCIRIASHVHQLTAHKPSVIFNLTFF